MDNIFNIVYIITNAFRAYVTFKFLSIFFVRDNSNHILEFLSCLLLFIGTSCIYLFINIPLVNIIGNVILILIITLNYKSTLKNRLLSTILIYAIFVLLEIVFILIFGKTTFVLNAINDQYPATISMIFINFTAYLIVLILGGLKNIKNQLNVPVSYWISIAFLPLSSLYLSILLVTETSISKINLIVCISAILLMNVIVFYLYDSINKYYSYKLEKNILSEQNSSYIKQYDLAQKSYHDIKSIEHDLKNHLSTIKSYINSKKENLVVDYIDELLSITNKPYETANSGNIVVDGLINLKSDLALTKNINIHSDIIIPKQLHMSDMDITIILGNLIDNAIYAQNNIDEDDRIINIKIHYPKNVLIIHIDNKYNHIIKHHNNNIISSKIKHKGYGLKNIQNALDKYNGHMQINENSNVFSVDIIIYDISSYTN